MLLMRMSAAWAVVSLFWWVIGTRMSLSPWVVAILPAAAAGLLMGWRSTGRGMLPALGLVLVVVWSSVWGEWTRVYGGLIEASRRNESASTEAHVEALMNAAIEKVGDPETLIEATGSPDLGGATWSAAGRLALDRTRREPMGLILSLAISMMAGIQAVRMTCSSKVPRES